MEKNIRILKWMYALVGFLPASAIWIIYFSDVAGGISKGALVVSVGVLVAALFDVPGGVVSDRLGRRVTAIGAAVSLALCVLAYAIAQNWWQLLIAATLDGFGMALMSGNNVALLRESLNALGRDEEFPVQLGQMMGWMHWTAFFAALVGSVMATVSLRLTVALGLPTISLCAILAFRLKEPVRHIEHGYGLSEHVKATMRTFTKSRTLLVLAGASMLSGGVGMAMFQCRPIWSAQLWPVWAIGLARAVSALFAAVGTWWGGWAVARFGAMRSMVVTQLCSSVADVVAPLSGSKLAPAVLTSSSLAFGMGTTADNVLLQHEFTDGQRATLGSVVGVGTRLIFALSAMAFGAMASPTVALVVGEAVMILSVGMYLIAFRPVIVGTTRKEELCIPLN